MPKGFFNENGKTKPITPKNGITPEQMNISVKGNNDKIEIGSKTSGMKGNRSIADKNIKLYQDLTEANIRLSKRLEDPNLKAEDKKLIEKELEINIHERQELKKNAFKDLVDERDTKLDKLLDSGKIFNLRQVKAELDGAEFEPNDAYGGDEDDKIQRIYAGSVYALTPSGKYYTAFANSNVNDLEAKKDEKWWKNAETELEKIGATLESGEDSPDELFIVRRK